MAERIQIRRDTAANWSSANPILADGEIGIEKQDGGAKPKLKIGDGMTEWNNLPYWSADIPPAPPSTTFIKFRIGDPNSPADGASSYQSNLLIDKAEADFIILRNSQIMWSFQDYVFYSDTGTFNLLGQDVFSYDERFLIIIKG